ncbi:MAG: helicase-related protein [Saprospiraceae bacterium]
MLKNFDAPVTLMSGTFPQFMEDQATDWFGFHKRNLIINRYGTVRHKLTLKQIKVEATLMQTIEDQIDEVFNKWRDNSNGIIFVEKRKQTAALKEVLEKRFSSISFYALRGNMEQSEQASILCKWKRNPGRGILIATTVAAQGVDSHRTRLSLVTFKPNEVCVLMQMLCRAGRDGGDAVAVMLDYGTTKNDVVNGIYEGNGCLRQRLHAILDGDHHNAVCVKGVSKRCNVCKKSKRKEKVSLRKEQKIEEDDLRVEREPILEEAQQQHPVDITLYMELQRERLKTKSYIVELEEKMSRQAKKEEALKEKHQAQVQSLQQQLQIRANQIDAYKRRLRQKRILSPKERSDSSTLKRMRLTSDLDQFLSPIQSQSSIDSIAQQQSLTPKSWLSTIGSDAIVVSPGSQEEDQSRFTEISKPEEIVRKFLKILDFINLPETNCGIGVMGVYGKCTASK